MPDKISAREAADQLGITIRQVIYRVKSGVILGESDHHGKWYWVYVTAGGRVRHRDPLPPDPSLSYVLKNLITVKEAQDAFQNLGLKLSLPRLRQLVRTCQLEGAVLSAFNTRMRAWFVLGSDVTRYVKEHGTR